MKKSLLVFALLMLSAILTKSFSQNCDYYIPLKEGKGMQMQSFSAKDKLTSTSDMKIVNVTTDGTGTTATLHVTSTNEKGKVHEGEFKVKCTGSGIVIDAQSFMDSKAIPEMKDMEVKIESIDFELPANLSVGTNLKDAQVKMTMSKQGMNFMENVVNFVNRKVAGQQKMTVPAGSFECYKITYDIQSEAKTMGMPTKTTLKSIEYFAKGVGNVRSERYDSSDKLMSYTVLTKIY